MAKEKKGLSTKDIKVGGSLPKILQPGNVTCKINAIGTEEFKLREGALMVVLELESEPITGFEGFLIDKDNPNGPKYSGQVGRIKATEWAFSDGETKSGVAILRDVEMLKFIKNLCVALDCVSWLDAQDGKHDTIESLVAAFNKSGKFKDIYLDFCLCGKEYQNKSNYTAYDLFLPRFSKAGAPFAPKGTKKVAIFDVNTHVKKKKVADTVAEFGEEESKPLDTGSTGPAEFEL